MNADAMNDGAHPDAHRVAGGETGHEAGADAARDVAGDVAGDVSSGAAGGNIRAVALAYAAINATGNTDSAFAQAALAAIDQMARATLEHTLCTVNRYDADTMRVVRLYSSNREAYPPGGSKNKLGTPWGRHVLLERRVFVGEGVQAIREFFDDHEAIRRLGLQSVINVPVVYGNECLGTVNFLMPRPTVSPADVDTAQLAALLALPAFLSLRAG